MDKRFDIEVSLCIVNKEGKILLMRRTNAHSEGTWSLPGGHLEMFEDIEECATREVLEEAGVGIRNLRFVGITNDKIPTENKHYITIFIESEHELGEAEIKEPDRATEIGWFAWNELPSPLFLPFKNFVENNAYGKNN